MVTNVQSHGLMMFPMDGWWLIAAVDLLSDRGEQTAMFTASTIACGWARVALLGNLGFGQLVQAWCSSHCAAVWAAEPVEKIHARVNRHSFLVWRW